MKPLTRKEAIECIEQLFERYFGCDKGSDELYFDFLESMGLVTFDLDTGDMVEDVWPGQSEFFLALGVQPSELIDIFGHNPSCYTKEMCEAYNVKEPPKSEEGERHNE